MTFTPPPADCPLCPRLVAFREGNARAFPQYYNGAVPSFGEIDATMLVVGLAPGLKGANATGRPFTGDYAGIVLYEALIKAGMTAGQYAARADDGFRLNNVRISNSVRCVPPENKPTPKEVTTCGKFLKEEIAAMPSLQLILTLGLTAHQSVLRVLGLKQTDYRFAHGALHDIGGGKKLLNSYHTSRYNVSTGRITQAMFSDIIVKSQCIIKS